MKKTPDFSTWLANRPIRVKLGLGFGAITGLALLLGGLTLFIGKIEAQALNRLNHTAEEVAASQDLQHDLLELRRNEKDFLLRYDSVGYEAGVAKYAELNNEQFGELVGNIVEIRALHSQEGVIDPGFEEAIDTVDEQFGLYITFFKALAADDARARGTHSEGPIPDIQEQIDQLDDLMLEAGAIDLVSQVDHLASDFNEYVAITAPGHATLDVFVTSQEEALANLNATLDELQRNITSEPAVSPTTRRKAIQVVEGIRQQVADLQAIDLKTARDIDRFRNAAHEIEPVLDQLIIDEQAELSEARASYEQVHAGGQFAQSVGLIVVLGLTIVFIGVLNQGIGEPVVALTDVARRMAEGDLLIRASVKTRDEIGTLGRAFNGMAGALHSRQAELQRANAELEERVKDRTVELQEALGEAREANRLKDLFLATMSHELRTPLNAIIGFLGLMMYSEELDDDNLHMAERAMTNSERLLGLINNILDLSRMGSGRLEIIPVEMSPKMLAQQLYEDLTLQVREKGLTFEMDVDDRLPEMIIHDEERITQIVINLVGNAAKFTDEGTIRLLFRRSDNERLIIKVTDTGVGIPLVKQDMIFDEFTQVDMDSTRRHGGAGLGLSIVKKLALLMDGTIRVESEVGRGSTFTVDLPLHLGEVPALLPVE